VVTPYLTRHLRFLVRVLPVFLF